MKTEIREATAEESAHALKLLQYELRPYPESVVGDYVRAHALEFRRDLANVDLVIVIEMWAQSFREQLDEGHGSTHYAEAIDAWEENRPVSQALYRAVVGRRM